MHSGERYEKGIRITVETYRWALSAILQATAALSAIVAVFLVFLLGDRVKRRDDFWKQFVSVFYDLRHEIGQGAYKGLSDKILTALATNDDPVTTYLSGAGSDQFQFVIGTKWDRYTIARQSAAVVDRVCAEDNLDPANRPGKLGELEDIRQRAEDFENALTSMKRELVPPAVLSGGTMVLSGIFLAISDVFFGDQFSGCSGWAAVVVWIILIFMTSTIAATGRAIARLLTKWDR